MPCLAVSAQPAATFIKNLFARLYFLILVGDLEVRSGNHVRVLIGVE